MTVPVIVGYDGRQPAHDALALGGALAAGIHPIVAAWVLEPDARSTPSDTQATRARHLQLEDFRAEVMARRPDPEPEPRTEVVIVAAQNPPEGLHELADDRRASVIVVGATHRGPIGRAIPGSTSGRLFLDGRHPVAVAPRDWALGEHAIDTIGVGFDGSPAAVGALDRATELASELSAGVVALTAGGDAESHLDSLTTPGGDRIDRIIVEGRAPHALARAAQDFDLLVIGSRSGRHAFTSVSHDLDHHSRVPLVVVPESVAHAAR
jgi:nucleotide-binding universal stress UspA family protein